MRVFVSRETQPVRCLAEDMVSRIAGLRLVAAARNEGEARAWLEDHPAEWDLAVIEVAQDDRQLEIVSCARRANPHAKIVVFSSIATPEMRSASLRNGADAAFHKMRAGDFVEWLDAQARGTQPASAPAPARPRFSAAVAGARCHGLPA